MAPQAPGDGDGGGGGTQTAGGAGGALTVSGTAGGGGVNGGGGGGGGGGKVGSDGGGGVNSGNGSITITPIFGCEPDTSFVGSTVTGSDAAYSLNCFYGGAFIDDGEQRATGGNHYLDGVTVRYENAQLCFSPPNGYSASGLDINQSEFRSGETCYSGTDAARVDDGIVKVDVTEDAVDSAITDCADTRVIVPDGSVPDGTEFIFTPNSTVRGVALLGQSVIRATCDITTNIGQSIFDPPIYICITHTPADILSAGGDVANLSVGYFDPESNTWQSYDNAPAGVGNADETCSSSDHLTQFGLMARVPTALPATGGALWSGVVLLFLSLVFLLALGLWRLQGKKEFPRPL